MSVRKHQRHILLLNIVISTCWSMSLPARLTSAVCTRWRIRLLCFRYSKKDTGLHGAVKMEELFHVAKKHDKLDLKVHTHKIFRE